MEKLHVVPAHTTPEVIALHPPNADATPGLAVRVPTSLLPRLGEHVLELQHVVFLDGFVVSTSCTDPLPVPAKLMLRLFESLNAVCARA
jgi:hypothetical protein